MGNLRNGNKGRLKIPPEPRRNRRDHYLPQGYLRGFIDPARANYQRPLWHFDILNNVWSERSPREIGYRLGFYDDATSQAGSGSADDDFRDLEHMFPQIRDELVASNFEDWQDFLAFLLCFAQMMRARSLLFFEHTQRDGKDLRAFTVEKVSSDRRTIKLRSLVPEPLPDSFVRNWTITKMREEINKGASWLKDFKWCLRYCDSLNIPFVISEIPLIATGDSPHAMDIFRDPDALLFFPICWQACLIGSTRYINPVTDKFGIEDMRRTQKIYREAANLFILSPSKIEFQ